MPVVIRDFEVVQEQPQQGSSPAAQGSAAEAPPTSALEQFLKQQRTREMRVRTW